MWFKFAYPFRTRPSVAGVVETVVAIGTTMAVTVFFVAMVVSPVAMQVPTT